MLVSTIVAITLGMAPVNENGIVSGDYSGIVGRFSQTVDRSGTTHVRGFHRLTGAPYEITIDKNGSVEGNVGEMTITFQIRDVG